MEQRIVDVENVSIKFNLSSEKIDSMKDYLVKRLKGQISFDEFWALQDISFSMNRGDSVALIGLNGCGKSTLLKIITGLYTEFEGDLEVNGIKMKELDWDKLRKEKFSVVPQRLYLSSDSVIEFLEKGLAKSKKNICITLEKDQEELSEFITTIKMNIDKSCENLSGGELRKINLWMALHKKSDVLILDEPTIELDKSSKEELFEYLKNRIQNKLLIVLTHDKELMGISDYVVDLNSGREVKL